MASALFCLALAVIVCSVAYGADDIDVGRIRTHANGSVLVTSPINGSVLLNGNDPLAEIAALQAENAVLKQNLNGVRSVVAGLGVKQFTVVLGSTQEDIADDAAVDVHGNVFVVGTTSGNFNGLVNQGEQDCFVVKYNNKGHMQWSRLIGSSKSEVCRGVATSAEGSVYVAGDTDGSLADSGNTTAGKRDAFIAKLSSAGDRLWTRQFGGSEVEICRHAAIDSSGNILVSGSSLSNPLDGNANAGLSDMFLAKYNSDGEKQWIVTHGSDHSEDARALATDRSDSVYLTGTTHGGLDGHSNAFSNSADMFLIKFSAAGVRQWTRQIGTTGTETGNAVATDGGDFVYVGGFSDGSINGATVQGGRDALVMKFGTATGDSIWTRQFGSPGSNAEDNIQAVAVGDDGSIYVTGMTVGSLDLDTNGNAGGIDVFVAKFAPWGERQWLQQYGDSGNDLGQGVAVDSTGNLFVVGITNGTAGLDGSSNSGDYDFFLSKFGLP